MHLRLCKIETLVAEYTAWSLAYSPGNVPTIVQKECRVGFHYRNDKESHTLQPRMPLILQHDVDTDVPLTYLSSFSINQHTDLLY